MATARKLPSGSWRVQAKKNGVTKSFTAETKRKAELLALEWQNSSSFHTDELILSDAYKRYIDSKSAVLSPSTVLSYEKISKKYLQEIMPKKMTTITAEEIQREINVISANHSPKTVKNIYSLLCAVYSMFFPERKIQAKLPQKVKTEIVIPTDEEIKLIIETATGEYKTAIMLGAFAGLRRGEIFALTSDDIKGNIITINKALTITPNGTYEKKPPKSFSGYRDIQIPEILKKELNGKKGNIITMHPNSIGWYFTKLLKRLGLPPYRFHDLRHYYVSHLFDIGLPEKYIIAQVGHSTSTITKSVYDHINKSVSEKYSDLISNSFDFYKDFV